MSNNFEPVVSFSEAECRVMRQLFDVMKLESGRTVTEEIRDVDNAPYVVGFKPEPGQVRLGKNEWRDFVAKLKKIVGE